MKTLDRILEAIKPIKIIGSVNKNIDSICYDSRNCTKNSLFVAIKGTNFDGANFIPEACSKGAIAVIYEGSIKQVHNEEITFIEVPNSKIALAQISNLWFDYPAKNLTLYGITGTNGKTTCTFIIKSLFESFGINTGIIGTTGYYIGSIKIPSTHTTPESLELFSIIAKMRAEGAKSIVMEASSHALHQNRVYGLEFDGAIFTNLTYEHLDYHKTMDEYAKAKNRLFQMLKSDGIAILNSDDDYSEYFKKSIKNNFIYTVGRNPESDFIIMNEKLNLQHTEYTIVDKNKYFLKNPVEIRTKLIGKFNIDNTAQSFVLCLAKGLQVNKLIHEIANVDGAPGRMHREPLRNGAIGIIDYAHTPDALEKALMTCRNILKEDYSLSKLICIFGCGGDRDKGKRPIMGKIATQLADFCIITNDNPRKEEPESIFADIIKGIPKDRANKFLLIPDREQAIAYAVEISNENDIILLAGKGHEDYQIIGTEKLHFDDVEQLRKFK